MSPSKPPGRALVLAALLLGALVLGVAAGLGGGSPGSSGPDGARTASGGGFEGAELPGAPAAPGFTLREAGGGSLSLASLRGRVAIVTFLRSRCGAACTLIAEQIRGALDELRRPVPVVVVSVDPAVDDAASVRRFLGAVSLLGRARWLSGPPAALRRAWRSYRITTPAAGAAAFEAAASVFLIDAAGRERVVYQQGQLTPESLAHDIGRLQGG